jgi:hypothetical protein
MAHVQITVKNTIFTFPDFPDTYAEELVGICSVIRKTLKFEKGAHP